MRARLETGALRTREDERCRVLEEKFGVAADLYRQQIEQLQRDNPNLRISFASQVLDVLRASNTRVNVGNGIVEI